MDTIENEITNSSEFLLMSFEQIEKRLQTNQTNVEEEKIYESIIIWVKYDLKNRAQFLPELIKYVKVLMIPISYFINYIESEEILRSHCPSFLYETLKTYVLHYCMKYHISNKHGICRKNELILIASYTNGYYNLEWMGTEKEQISSIKFTWSTFNSIILNDGRIFCAKECLDNRIWYARIFNGTTHTWNSIGSFKFINDKGVCSNLVQLDEWVYMMSPSGYFIRYNYTTKDWQNLQHLTDDKLKFRNLIVLNGLIYCISIQFIFQYDPIQNTWNILSQRDFSRWYGYATCSLDDYLYLFGGIKKGEYLKSAVRYKPSTNSWFDIADMHVPRWNAGAVAVNGLIYVIGGNNCDSFETYDPESNIWTISDMKLGSNKHQITRAFVLDPITNIISTNITDYYSEYQCVKNRPVDNLND